MFPFQVLSSSRSFFGVEDFVDEDNSRPYTYKKEKRSKNPTSTFLSSSAPSPTWSPSRSTSSFPSASSRHPLHTDRLAGRSQLLGPTQRTSKRCSSQGPTYQPAWPWAVSCLSGQRRPTCIPARTHQGSGTSSRGRSGQLFSH